MTDQTTESFGQFSLQLEFYLHAAYARHCQQRKEKEKKKDKKKRSGVIIHYNTKTNKIYYDQ